MKNMLPVVAVLALAGCVATPLSDAPINVENTRKAEAAVGTWTPSSALQARVLLEEYGYPDEVRDDRLAWLGRGPWDRIDVWNAPVGATDIPVVQQTIGYPLTDESIARLREFDARLICDPATGRLSARSDSEDKNFLLLNLADDIANGRKSVLEARDSYKDILDKSYSGKSSPYLKGLLFRFGSVK
jgi:hypothetical protein